MRSPLVLCAKSTWRPSIRREHAWAQLASLEGHTVTFVERPSDVRSVSDFGVESFIRRLRTGELDREITDIRVIRRSTLIPGHRGIGAARASAAGLRRQLSRLSSPDASVVVNTPWDWQATSGLPAKRRIFDMADDWTRLMPGRERRFARYFDEISAEADEIIVVNPDLNARFPGRTPVLVRNGVWDGALGPIRSPPSGTRTFVYLGTLSERFDAPLVEATLQLLPDWRCELVGQCQYEGHGDRPARELLELLASTDRVRWHGPAPRHRALTFIDGAAVAILPNRAERSAGQDSMKFYDYSARGRPTVSTHWFSAGAVELPPHLRTADTPKQFADAIWQSVSEPGGWAAERQAWAAARTWAHRWPQWSAAVFGQD